MTRYPTTVSPADVADPNDRLAEVAMRPQDRREYASAGADARSSTRGHRGRGIGSNAEVVAVTSGWRRIEWQSGVKFGRKRRWRLRDASLPSVWENVPDPREFLLHLKQKAGLSPKYWSETIRVERYTAESVGEDAKN